MTIASEIERLQDVRTDIYDELGNKCVNLDGSSKYADVAPIIKKMPVVCAKIGANKYPVVKIGNQLWTAKNLDEDLGSLGVNEWYYNGRTEKTNYIKERASKTVRIVSSGSSLSLGILCDFDDVNKTTKDIVLAVGETIYYSVKISINEAIDENVVGSFRVNKDNVGDAVIKSSSVIIEQGQTSAVISGTWTNNAGKTFNTFKFRLDTSLSSASIFTISELYFSIKSPNGSFISSPTIPEALANEATYKKYGRLYTWDNVNTNLASLGLQGWRMPTKADANYLYSIDEIGKKLCSKSWNKGTDELGFNALDSGIMAIPNFSGFTFNMWTSENVSASESVRYRIQGNNKAYVENNNKARGLSVRLVCDLNEDGSIPDGAVIIAEADESVATLADDGVAVASVEPSTDTEG